MSSFSAVMVSYHTGPVLFAAIKSVLRQKNLAKLIVVDNGNPPDVRARLQQMALTEPLLEIVTGHGNVGFAKGCNLGAARAVGEFLLVFNPHCLLPPDSLVAFAEVFASRADVTIAGGMLLNADGSVQRDYIRPLPTPADVLRVQPASWFARAVSADSLSNQTQEVASVGRDCLCIRLDDFKRLLGFDEAYFMYMEDIDLCSRVHKLGGKVLCLPRVLVTDMRDGSEAASSRKREWYKSKGYIRYLGKHFSGKYFPGMLVLAKSVVWVRYALRVFRASWGSGSAQSHSMVRRVPTKRLMILASGLVELPESRQLYGKTVLVTGATGQVGLCVIRRMLAAGAAVLAISRGEAIPYQHPHLRWIKGDLTDDTLHLHGYLVDIAVHCAPLWHLPSTIDLLADAEVTRLIAFSSTSVFAKALSRNSYEKELVGNLAKAEAEVAERCVAKGIRWTILRPTMIYGVGLDLNITTLAKAIRRLGFFPVYPPAFGRRQPVHADDLALAVMQAVENEITYNKSYNVSGGEVITYRDMLERIFQVCGQKVIITETTLLPVLLDVLGKVLRRKHINGEVARRMNDDLIFFHDDARRDFHYSPRPFLSGGIRDIEGF